MARDPMVVVRLSQLRRLIREELIHTMRLTNRLLTDKEMAAFMGYSYDGWQALVRKTPDLAIRAVTPPGTTRRRWAAWEIYPLFQAPEGRARVVMKRAKRST